MCWGTSSTGFSGELDHAMASADLFDNVTGATIWHINADEPVILDYNLDFGRDPSLFEENAFRASDHDPLIVGLTLDTNEAPTVDAGGPYAVAEGSSVTLTATVEVQVTDPIEKTARPNQSGLSYDSTTDTYTYIWKTSKAWKGTCQHFVITFVDGTSYTADFQFKG
jgi:hypothetical protein